MKRFSLLIFSVFLLFFLIPQASASKSFTGELDDRFQKTLLKIFQLNKEIKRNTGNILLDEVVKKRNTYTRYAKSLYRHMELRNTLKPTLDVSSRYKLSLQKYKLSCEIAALRMVVEAVSGKYISEEEIIREIPHFPFALNDGIWGDPEIGFVGSYTGSQKLATGYGIYGLPLARYLDRKGYDNIYYNTLTGTIIDSYDLLGKLLVELDKENHIIFWADWCTTPDFDDGIIDKIDMYIVRNFGISGKNECERNASERRITWKTQAGVTIDGISGEHAFLLLGYIGSKNNPSHIIVWDTDTGKHIYPILEWMRKWSLLEYRSLVVKKNMYGNKN